MGKIIGLHGKAGSGKDTIANHLKTYYARNFRSVAFADALREMLKAGFGLTDTHFERPLKEEILPEYGITPRDFLKPLGTEWGREILAKIPGWTLEDGVWISRIAPKVSDYIGAGFNVLVTDVRFENEAEWIRKNGGVVWHIDRASTKADAHKSEVGIKFAKGDVKINNNETLGWLYDTVEGLAKKIIAEEDEKDREAAAGALEALKVAIIAEKVEDAGKA